MPTSKQTKPAAKLARRSSASAKRVPTRASVARHLDRVRRVCESLPEVTERLSHGEPTWFVRKRVFVMLSADHHGDGRLAVVIPFDPGLQSILIEDSPKTYYYPPYVGVRGWLGISLPAVTDTELREHIIEAWRRVAPRRLLASVDTSNS